MDNNLKASSEGREISLKEQGYEGFTKIPKEDFHIKSNNELIAYTTTNKWSGNGTNESPFVVVDYVSDNLNILKTNYHIIFRNCIFDVMNLQKCKNVHYHNCKIKSLNLTLCSNIKTNSSHISILNLRGLTHSQFIKCKIDKLFNDFSRENVFEDCKMSQSTKEAVNTSILEQAGIKNIAILLPLILIPLVPFLFYIDYIPSIPTLLPIYLIFLSGFVIILLTSLMIWYKFHKAEKQPSKII